MDATLLQKYKEKYASYSIQKRATNIQLTSINKQSNDSYQFSYKGSQKTPYKIKVHQKNKTIISTCSCPYDWGGICKHEAAAIDYIINTESNSKNQEDLFENDIKPTHKEIKNLTKEGLFLEDHKITASIIDWVNNNSQLQNIYIDKDYFEVLSLQQTRITTKYQDWPIAKQVFEYNLKENNLKASCDCNYSGTNFCKHIAPALSALMERYGPNIFSPDYLDDAKSKFLEQYGMSLEDDYQKYFEFQMTPFGLEAKEKIKNIVPSLAVAKEKFLPQLDEKTEDKLHLNKTTMPAVKTHGIGFCFEFSDYEDQNFRLIPFKAKYKKHSKDFVSSFSEIEEFNLFSHFKDLDAQDKNSVIAALEFEEVNNKFLRTLSIETLHETNIAFRNFLDVAGNYPFFEKKLRKTLIKRHLSKLNIISKVPKLLFKLSSKNDFYCLKPILKLNGKRYQINSNKLEIFPLFCKKQSDLYLFENTYPFIYIHRFSGRSELNFQKKEYSRLYKEILEPLSKHFEIETKVYKTSAKNNLEDTNLKKQVYISDYEGEYIIFKPGVQYGKELVLLHSMAELFDDENQQIKKRNASFENNFLEDFKELHPDFKQQSPPFFLNPQQLIEDEWLLNTSEKLKQQSVEIFGANDLKSFKYNLHKPTVNMGVNSNLDWFDLEIEVKYGKERVSLKEIRKALLKKNQYVQLKDGSLGVLPQEWLKKFAKYFKAGEVKNNKIKISNYQFNIIDELHQELETTPQFLIELQQKRQRLQNLKTEISVQPPKNVKASLRPYQQEGLNWLVFLEKNKLGGCLADDMGLGKTLQTIVFLSYLKKHKKSKKPHLVIAPTSLIFNWQKELEKFCPSLKALLYVGGKRKETFNSFSKYDIIISTYGSLLNDIEFLKDFPFNYVILDESQAIKNPNSKRYKAVRLLKSENRLALTGTPIENNTFDLYAQMNFLNPGLLGSMSHFKKEFSEAIDKEKNEDASTLLGQMIFPFLLRRTKEQVATELPEKTETVLYCEMGGEQRKIYNTFKDKFRDYLLNKIDENGAEKSQMYVLEGLTKLRQICNSPELLSEEEDYGKASIKLDVLIDHIKSKTTNHKILVFSQFTSMLALVKERLKEEGLVYEYLDGKTKNREERVNNFQTDTKIKVFLISLKAGGTGLNLTAADYVFLIDPWWNPAVESQAIDRCYRIGQTSHVMAYKMICKDTVEEKIIDLQQNKKMVSSSILSTDTGKKSFNSKQIKELFS